MIMPKTIIFHNTLFAFTFLYLMVSPHTSYAEQKNYQALNTAQFQISKKITKDDKLFDIPEVNCLATNNYLVRLDSIQTHSAMYQTPTLSLLYLSTTRLLL